MINGYKIDLACAIDDGKYDGIAIAVIQLQKFLISLIRKIREIRESNVLDDFELTIDDSSYIISVIKYSVNPIIYEFY